MPCGHDYSGARRPESLCPGCWTIYGRQNPASVAGQYLRELGPAGPLGHGVRQLTHEMCALLLVLGRRLDGVEGANGEGRD